MVDKKALKNMPPIADVRAEMARRTVDEARNLIAKGRMTLSNYIKCAWNVVEPSRPYVHGWHIDAIAEHMTAVTKGEIIRLLITEPPGMMKSLLTSVFWPTWEWGPQNMPSLRYINYSFDTSLATRDSLKARRLINSSWYQSLWGNVFKLTSDQNVKTRYENDKTGYRIADYVGGGTGDRGDRNIVDDPHNIKDGESETMRNRALLWLHETLPSRLNDPEYSSIIVIHHRIHPCDMAGDILEHGLGYEHLMLPMEFDPKRRCTTSIGFSDPRKKEGELLFPQRFPREVVERDKRAMGSYAVAGQFQQDPQPRGGGMFKREWFEIVDAAPADCKWVRHWDLAATRGGGAFTAGVLLGRSRSTKMFYVRDVKRGQIEGDQVKRLIRNTAIVDEMEFGKGNYMISLPQDPGQAGKVQIKDMTLMLAGFNVHSEPETGDKETRAEPFAAQAEAGNVKLVRGNSNGVVDAKWIAPYLDEMELFPNGKYKDQADASSGAFGKLITQSMRETRTSSIVGLY